MMQSNLVVKVRFMKTLWQWDITIMQVEAKTTFGNSGAVHPFNGLKIQKAPHVNKDSSLITVQSFFSSSWM
jgi:hypothetical protein